jgi:hypothetical protein
MYLCDVGVASVAAGAGRRRSSNSSTGSWKKIQSLEDGVSYWFNQETGESQWEDPTGAAPDGQEAASVLARQRSTRSSAERIQFEMNHNAILSPKGKKLFEF